MKTNEIKKLSEITCKGMLIEPGDVFINTKIKLEMTLIFIVDKGQFKDLIFKYAGDDTRYYAIDSSDFNNNNKFIFQRKGGKTNN